MDQCGAKQRICTNLPTRRDFSCAKYQNPSLSQTLNIFPETKHYFLLRNSFLLSVRSQFELIMRAGSVVISRERFQREPCWLAFSSNIIRGPSISENDRHLCVSDERIRRDSCQNILRKTPYSVRKSEQCRVSTVYAWNAWDHDPPFGDQERLAFYASGLRKPEYLLLP